METTTKKKTFKLISGSHEEQGPRKTMEDTHKRIDNVHTDLPDISIKNYSQVAYYAVYDGHGGAQTAEMVVERLHPQIFKSDHFNEGNVEAAIHQGFQEMDKYVVDEANKQNSLHGCTCVCCLVLDGKVYFANIGDSEGILVSVENGTVTAKNMTKAHKANEPSEKERIESMGGHVFFGRVYGSLAVSRSFGDAKYKRPKTSKDFVSWEPHTEIETLTTEHKYMILACDGLFDVMTHQEVADMTHRLFEDGRDASYVAHALVSRAVRELQTEDNVTVIVVKIEWEDEGATKASEHIPNTEEEPTKIPHSPREPCELKEPSPKEPCQNDSEPEIELEQTPPTPVQTPQDTQENEKKE